MAHLLWVVVAIALTSSMVAMGVSYTPFAAIKANADANQLLEDLRKAEAGINAFMISEFDGTTITLPADDAGLTSALIPNYLFAINSPRSHLVWSYGLGTRAGMSGIYACISGFTSEDETLRNVLFNRMSRALGARAVMGASCGDTAGVSASDQLQAVTVWRMVPHVVAEQVAQSWVPGGSTSGTGPGPSAPSGTAHHTCYEVNIGDPCQIKGHTVRFAGYTPSPLSPIPRNAAYGQYRGLDPTPDSVFFSGPVRRLFIVDLPEYGKSYRSSWSTWTDYTTNPRTDYPYDIYPFRLLETQVPGSLLPDSLTDGWYNTQVITASEHPSNHPAVRACSDRASASGINAYLPSILELRVARDNLLSVNMIVLESRWPHARLFTEGSHWSSTLLDLVHPGYPADTRLGRYYGGGGTTWYNHQTTTYGAYCFVYLD